MEKDLEKLLRDVVKDEITNQLKWLQPDLFHDDALLTAKQLAKITGQKPQTFAVWRTRGGSGPNYVKVGNNVRYRYSDVKKWLDERTVKVS